jgi:hypothetical protein
MLCELEGDQRSQPLLELVCVKRSRNAMPKPIAVNASAGEVGQSTHSRLLNGAAGRGRDLGGHGVRNRPAIGRSRIAASIVTNGVRLFDLGLVLTDAECARR